MPGKFIIADKKRFALPGTQNRYWHLATIHYGLREFMYFVDMSTTQSWIEEITGGHLSEIEEDDLWNDLTSFIREKKLGEVK